MCYHISCNSMPRMPRPWGCSPSSVKDQASKQTKTPQNIWMTVAILCKYLDQLWLPRYTGNYNQVRMCLEFFFKDKNKIIAFFNIVPICQL